MNLCFFIHLKKKKSRKIVFIFNLIGFSQKIETMMTTYYRLWPLNPVTLRIMNEIYSMNSKKSIKLKETQSQPFHIFLIIFHFSQLLFHTIHISDLPVTPNLPIFA